MHEQVRGMQVSMKPFPCIRKEAKCKIVTTNTHHDGKVCSTNKHQDKLTWLGLRLDGEPECVAQMRPGPETMRKVILLDAP